jgi:hypothetical protein
MTRRLNRTTPRTLPPPTRFGSDGRPLWHCTAPLDEELFTRLELYRIARKLSRADAMRQLFNEHLPTSSDAD